MPKLEQIPLDKRIRDLNLQRGKITQADIDKHIKNLPDDSKLAEELIVYEVASDTETGEETNTEAN